ncbi:NADH-quinone oxidoreductase subunit N [bacterium]|nr:MAG: NADH-quinone oxidoreductase subunit N [candidate division KSB1 bacterium]MBC6949477.1 NADH-quinone oxidoreductase subunit N [candidate division KSB1 bacterium]MCE7944084.1 NADH-quinone oxidoreductase subunit N [Chlorobi bacterium CHB1]MCL4706355.1 NADH-quinone oxidoreductase subunit N [bacterium]MDL1874437.1 NADH-quinone oxidoreductase subunit N [Cytophagia bacterium CHB2]
MDIAARLQDNIASLNHFLPEFILIGLMLVLMIADVFIKREQTPWLGILTLVGGIICLIAVLGQSDEPGRGIFNNMMAVDRFATFFKLIFLGSMIMTVLLSFSSLELAGRSVGEYFILLTATTLGMLWMASATNLITIFIAIETVSISSFALATYLKSVKRSSEAGLKYTIYGTFSSGLMLYGFSLIYGLTGSLNIYEISHVLSTSSPNALTLFVAFLLILAGFGYKIASVPFHFWAPDVYEGAPTPVTAFFSVGPKAAGFALLIRFVTVGLSTSGSEGWTTIAGLNWQQLLAVVSAATMTLGNLVAIVQTNMKRLLAYSSIAHAGYALMGVVLLTQEGINATMFYLVAYYLMNLGAFLVVIIVQELIGSERLQDYRGLGFRAPVVAACMTLFLFSLTGLPITIGFIGKFYLLAAVIQGDAQFYWLAVVAIINTVISLYYYARIIKAMYLEAPPEPATGRLTVAWPAIALLALLAVPTFVFGILFGPLYNLTKASVKFFAGI